MSGDPPDQPSELPPSGARGSSPVHRRLPGLAVNHLLSAPAKATQSPKQSVFAADSESMTAPSIIPVNKPLPPPPPTASAGSSSGSSKRGQARGKKAQQTSGTPEGGVAYHYSSVKQTTENRHLIEYDLTIREQPKHSRMCGVGEKADRRPIDPAPIVQLRIITHTGPPGKPSVGDDSNSGPETSPVGRRGLDLGRPPSGPGALRQGVPVTTEWGEGWEDKSWYLDNPYFFMFAILADAESDKELHLLQDGKTRYTTGSCVSSLYHLKDIDGSHQGFFVFPDLSIRVEGRYRLKLCLFETIGHEVYHCRSIFSAPFNVFTAKRFPGMEESTQLSKSFADQGLKLRVRKNPRMKRKSQPAVRPSQLGAEEGSEGSDKDDAPSRLPPAAKRMRGSVSVAHVSGSGPVTAAAPRKPPRPSRPTVHPPPVRFESSPRYADQRVSASAPTPFPLPTLPTAGSTLPPLQAHPFDLSARQSTHSYRQASRDELKSRASDSSEYAARPASNEGPSGSQGRPYGSSGMYFPISAATEGSSPQFSHRPVRSSWAGTPRSSFFDNPQGTPPSDRRLPSPVGPPARRSEWGRMSELAVTASGNTSGTSSSRFGSSPMLPPMNDPSTSDQRSFFPERRPHSRTRSGSPASVHLPPPALPPPSSTLSYTGAHYGSLPSAGSGWTNSPTDERTMQTRRDLVLPPLAFGPGAGGGNSSASIPGIGSGWGRWDREREGPRRDWPDHSSDVAQQQQRDREWQMAREAASSPPPPSLRSMSSASFGTAPMHAAPEGRDAISSFDRDRGWERERERDRERERQRRDER